MYRVKMELCGMCMYQEDFKSNEEAKAKAQRLRETEGDKDMFGHKIKITVESI